MNDLANEIKKLKQEKDAVLLAHNYQIEEVQLQADYLGDSLDLSRRATDIKAELIVFAGVKFMAETAKILAPEKTVLLPRLDAGCPMADMITVEELLELKKEHPRAKVVTYVNSSVEIKAESDVCCTSANAVQVVENIEADEIIFVPDRNLGSYIQAKVPGKRMILFEGYCYVHNRIKKEEILAMKEKFPQALVLVHPECKMEVIDLANKVFSTSGMLKYAAASDNKDFIVATEQGLLERMKRENPGKKFHPAFKPKICSNMKKTALIDIYQALTKGQYEIEIDEITAKRAVKALTEMLKYI